MGRTVEQADALIGGRYRIRHLLGRGGMAEVYRVLDERSSNEVALKRCMAYQGSKAVRHAAMLEREYHTLAQLAHPCIIEVFDFGVDERGPYYTMELLQGSNLQNLDRVPWQTACIALRDVASALAMLHMRGVVHRDVSMRNVHWSASQHAKLIDFGAMMPMGVATDVVGTPPFAAPELVQLQALDGRCDLFSLGALAYRLLTGRHAYPARRFSELRDSWRTKPPAPVTLAPDLPPELSALVQRLIALDRAGRPRSAAEIIEQLGAIAHLEHEDASLISRAYLTMPTLVGREAATVTVRRQVLSLVRGDGGVLAVRGVSGSGRSRMLDACALEGKLLGVAVVRVGARDALYGDWGVARALGNQLVALFPKQAADAARLSRAVLAEVVDELQPEESTELSPSVAERSRVIHEYRDWLFAICKSQRILLIIDDVERIDEPSSALVLAIANKARRHPLLLALAWATDAKDPPPRLELLGDLSRSVALEHLQPQATEALLQSMFGEVPNLPHCAARIHGLAHGNPRAIMELAQHLVDTGQARYAAGAWVLPDRLSERDLPSGLADSLLARLSELSEDARELADALALTDEDELNVAQYLALTGHGDSARMFRAIHELCSARIVVAEADHVSFAQRGFLTVLHQAMSDDRRRALHGRVATRLPEEATSAVRRCHHLLAAGLDAEAIDELARMEIGLQPPPIPLLQAALERAERARMPASTLHRLRMAILLAAPYTMDHKSFRRVAPAVFARLEQESGLAAYRELLDVPEGERLSRAIVQAQQLYAARPEHERVYPLLEAIRELARLTALVPAIAAAVFDLELLEALPSLDPLLALSPSLVVVAQLVEGAKEWTRGRLQSASEIYSQILARIGEADRAGLDASQHERMHVGLEYALGTLEALSGIAAAEERAQRLERHRALRANAWRIRSLMQMAIGNTVEADKNARRVVLIEAQQGLEERYVRSTVGMELILRSRLGDLLGLRACVDTLEKLAREHPGWRAVALLGRSSYAKLQGDFEAALRHVLEGLALAPPARHPFYVSLAALHIELQVALGQLPDAMQLTRDYLRVATAEELGTLDIRLHGALAFAKAGLFDEAEQVLSPALELVASAGYSGLACGIVYATRAQIALAARDRPGFEQWFERCGSEYKKAQNPALNAELTQLYEAAAAAGLCPVEHLISLQQSLAPSTNTSDQDSIHSRMAECVDAAERARYALTLLLQQLGSSFGYLYAPEANGETSLIAALPHSPRSGEVQDWVERYVRDWSARAAASTANDNTDAAIQSSEAETESLTADATQTGPDVATQTQAAAEPADPYRYMDEDGCRLEALSLTQGYGPSARLAAVLVVQSVRGQRAFLPPAVSAAIAHELLASRAS